MSNKLNDHSLPPKSCSIDQLVTIEQDIQKVIDGKKVTTRRSGIYADIGEVMSLGEHQFIIEHIYSQRLGDMTNEDAQQEGYKDLEDYKKFILSIHPGMKWSPKMKVWVHQYEPVQTT